ncbi:hypothetical protein ABZ504_41275, partial [Streptomyces mirabilis]
GLVDDVLVLTLAAQRDDQQVVELHARCVRRGDVVNTDILRAARDVLPNPERSITSIANLSGSALARSTTASPTSGSAAPPWR